MFIVGPHKVNGDDGDVGAVPTIERIDKVGKPSGASESSVKMEHCTNTDVDLRGNGIAGDRKVLVVWRWWHAILRKNFKSKWTRDFNWLRELVQEWNVKF